MEKLFTDINWNFIQEEIVDKGKITLDNRRKLIKARNDTNFFCSELLGILNEWLKNVHTKVSDTLKLNRKVEKNTKQIKGQQSITKYISISQKN